MATYEQLKAQAQALLEQAEQVRRQELAGVIEEIRATMAAYGITPKDLGFERKSAGAGVRSEKPPGGCEVPRARRTGVVRSRPATGLGGAAAGRGQGVEGLRDSLMR